MNAYFELAVCRTSRKIGIGNQIASQCILYTTGCFLERYRGNWEVVMGKRLCHARQKRETRTKWRDRDLLASGFLLKAPLIFWSMLTIRSTVALDCPKHRYICMISYLLKKPWAGSLVGSGAGKPRETRTDGLCFNSLSLTHVSLAWESQLVSWSRFT